METSYANTGLICITNTIFYIISQKKRLVSFGEGMSRENLIRVLK